MKKEHQTKRLSTTDQASMLAMVSALEAGGLVLYPTDTVWGLGCDATNKEAVDKIYALKKRDQSKSLIVLLENSQKLTNYVKEIPDVAWDIIDTTESPVTIIYPEGKNLAPNACAQDGSIGIRLIKDPFFLVQVLRKFKKPIVSTSANLTGEDPGKNLEEINDKIKRQVDYIVKLDQLILSKLPSSIIKIGLEGQVKIIRK